MDESNSIVAAIGGDGNVWLAHVKFTGDQIGSTSVTTCALDGVVHTAVDAFTTRREFLCGTVDGTVVIWSASNAPNHRWRSFVAHKRQIRTVAVNEVEDCFATGGDDGFLMVWATGGCRAPIWKIYV